MKIRDDHRVPLTDAMLQVPTPFRALESEIVFDRQKRHKPLPNMAMSMPLRRMELRMQRSTVSAPRSGIGPAKSPTRHVSRPR